MSKDKLIYRVINIANGSKWEGPASNAKEAYTHIKIAKGDTTICTYGKQTSVKEW